MTGGRIAKNTNTNVDIHSLTALYLKEHGIAGPIHLLSAAGLDTVALELWAVKQLAALFVQVDRYPSIRRPEFPISRGSSKLEARVARILSKLYVQSLFRSGWLSRDSRTRIWLVAPILASQIQEWTSVERKHCL
jgi:hypothetical protein